jgi:hypothetical protein
MEIILIVALDVPALAVGGFGYYRGWFTAEKR